MQVPFYCMSEDIFVRKTFSITMHIVNHSVGLSCCKMVAFISGLVLSPVLANAYIWKYPHLNQKGYFITVINLYTGTYFCMSKSKMICGILSLNDLQNGIAVLLHHCCAQFLFYYRFRCWKNKDPDGFHFGFSYFAWKLSCKSRI